MKDSTHGTLSAIAAFSLWAILPLYWKSLDGLPILEVTAHRVLWTLAFLLAWFLLQRRLRRAWHALRNTKALAIHSIAATCLAANWLIYVWATLNDRILEGALGYYINPFLYILLGSLFLGEKHDRLQMAAIVIAAIGVALQFPAIDGVPWSALGLAISFAAYGMIRKKSPLGSFDGLCVEMCIMLPLATIYLYLIHHNDGLTNGHFGSDPRTTWLLVGTGVATAAPLLFFARGARSISLSLLGILQFIGPTGQLIIGWTVYGETMPPLRILSFAFIWWAVILYTISLLNQPSKHEQGRDGKNQPTDHTRRESS